jgi:hypothetical protein
MRCSPGDAVDCQFPTNLKFLNHYGRDRIPCRQAARSSSLAGSDCTGATGRYWPMVRSWTSGHGPSRLLLALIDAGGKVVTKDELRARRGVHPGA